MSLRRSNSSSLFSQTRQHLLAESPLPSPSLPSILPRHGKRQVQSLTKKILRILTWLIGVVILLWAADRLLRSERSLTVVSYMSSDGKSYEIVGEETLPDEPTPVMVTDRRGRTKWTVSIPHSLGFPLKPSQYQDICSLSADVAQRVVDSKSHSNGPSNHASHHGYYYVDPNFMDVADAQSHGLLPDPSTLPATNHDLAYSMLGGDPKDFEAQSPETLSQCSSSLTFLLETSDAGMGPTLLSLWLAYGLAQHEKRAFFLDDANWPYGSYTTYFKPPPSPSCAPPPSTQRVPCPHSAQHLVVSAATIQQVFGHEFNEAFQDPKKMGVARQGPIFDLMRKGYEDLFHLPPGSEDANFLASRLAELDSTVSAAGGIRVGVHVRHGDRHPLEFQYQKSYLPLSTYASAAKELIAASGAKLDISRMIVASDDPDVYTASELFGPDTDHPAALRAQSRISLASKSSLSDGKSGSKPSNKPDDSLGWEGGFFKSVFWSLGHGPQVPKVDSPQPSRRRVNSPSSIPKAADDSTHSERQAAGADADEETQHKHPGQAALKLRELVGRAYVLDLAVLGQGCDWVVCGVSSATCRALGVMRGWEGVLTGSDLGIGGGGGVKVSGGGIGWKNVDGEFDWRGVAW